MSETMFTPGPWIVHPLRAWVSPVADLEMPVCQLRHPADDLPEQQVFATGRLIAAAPDLYSALETLRRATLDDRSDISAARSDAAAALAKARGEIETRQAGGHDGNRD